MTKKKKPTNSPDTKSVRLLRNETQADYWQRFGVTQSGGSRYESGRGIPKPTAMLMEMFNGGLISSEMLAKVRRKVESRTT
jgi:hypothetical protein